MLTGPDRRSLGRANEVAAMLSAGEFRWGDVVGLVFDKDVCIRIRAADALEKASRDEPRRLARFKPHLLTLLREADVNVLRWHAALMLPRLPLSDVERDDASVILRQYLEDKSSIVKTTAMDALAKFAEEDRMLRPETRELLRVAERSGTPAMQARARNVLKKWERKGW